MSEMEAILKDFLIESFEALEQVDRDLVALENAPRDRSAWDRVLRVVHSLKGTCGFLGFGVLESVTHIGESVLVKLRDGDLILDSRITTLLLALIDAIRSLLQQIEEKGADSGCDYSALVNDLTTLNREAEAEKNGAEPSVEEVAPEPELPTATQIDCQPPEEIVMTMNAMDNIESNSTKPAVAVKQEPEEAPREEHHKAAPAQTSSSEPSEPKQGKVADATVRVDVELLDKLVNVVGELVLTRNQMLRYTSSLDDSTLIGALQRLNLITSDLQESVMRTRMQTVGTVWSKFPKLVHEVAQICKKNVRLEMEGKETELDKTLLEAIKDPLTHIIRNCVDHGLETPEVRVENGKKAEGTIWLRATHESGNVIIEIVDDGRGIDPARIKAKAIEKGLISTDKAARMSERELLNLIFLPGFSTAEQVTNISGRGVGMDVVRSNLQRINGSVDLQSHTGKGTTVRMKIPLTLAIVPALVIEHQGERYAIPQAHLKEVVRVQNATKQLSGHSNTSDSAALGTSTQISTQSRQGVERVNNSLVYRLRGKLIPLVDLRTELELEGINSTATANQAATGVVTIAILEVDNRIFGLIIENVLDTQEIVVKPLGKQFSHVKSYAGSAVMGDGRVALILDVLGLEQKAHAVTEHKSFSEAEARAALEHDDEANEQGSTKHFLLVEVGNDERMAIPLDNVARLETLKRSALEKTGHVPVVQYRNSILRIIDLRDLLGKSGRANETATDDYQLVVCKNGDYAAGLVVNEIVDIVEDNVEFTSFETGEYCSGTAVMGDKVTTLINADALLNKYH